MIIPFISQSIACPLRGGKHCLSGRVTAWMVARFSSPLAILTGKAIPAYGVLLAQQVFITGFAMSDCGALPPRARDGA